MPQTLLCGSAGAALRKVQEVSVHRHVVEVSAACNAQAQCMSHTLTHTCTSTTSHHLPHNTEHRAASTPGVVEVAQAIGQARAKVHHHTSRLSSHASIAICSPRAHILLEPQDRVNGRGVHGICRHAGARRGGTGVTVAEPRSCSEVLGGLSAPLAPNSSPSLALVHLFTHPLCVRPASRPGPILATSRWCLC